MMKVSMLMLMAFFDFQDTRPLITSSLWANQVMAQGYAERLHISEDLSREIIAVVNVQAQIHKVDPWLVLGMVQVESGGNPKIVSNKGAVGLMQIVPETGEWIAEKLGEEWLGTNVLIDPKCNLRYGIWYLKHLTERFGNTEAALAAYFWGPGNIERRLQEGKPLPTQYTRKVLDAAYGY
jgi:soluble lytic murein transglycosylase-like protein